MKKFKDIDKDIQQFLFEDNVEKVDPELINSDDFEKYQMISSGLSDEPKYSLDVDFAEKVTKKAVRRKNTQAILKVLLTYSLVGLTLVLSAGAVFYFMAKDTFSDLLRLATEYNIQIVFTIMLFLIIQVVDKILIRKHSNLNIPE